MDIVDLDGTTLAQELRAGTLSCVEVLQAYLARIDARNPRFNAIVALRDREALVAEARERDAQRARGEPCGALHGIPLAVKDLSAVKGLPWTQGSTILRGTIAPADSPMVARLRAAGAIFLGKTNTPEFGLGSHTFNPVYGASRNALDPSRSAGGSSGGAAVALALRMLPFADGSDYGGSLRNPAGWNQVYGLRTSIGLVPQDARDAWLPSMGVQGPMARTVTDLATLLSVQAAAEPGDPLGIPCDTAQWGKLEATMRGRRIAWGGDLGGATPCEPGVLEACGPALRVFESLGCVVEEDYPRADFEALWQATKDLRAWQIGSALLPLYQDRAHRDQLKPEAIFEIETGARLSAYDIAAASQLRTRWTHALRAFFARHDALVLPTAQVFPFAIDERWPGFIAGQRMQTYHEWMKANLLVTMSGCPSLAAPAGLAANGLPMGIQIIVPVRRETDCLQLAFAYEAASAHLRVALPA